jgi:hypothetical protein
MNIDLNQISLDIPPIEVLRLYAQKLELDVLPFFDKPQTRGNPRETNQIKATIARFNYAVQQLEELGKQTQFTNVAEVWNQIEAEAKASSQQPAASSKKRLCKIDPNTDSFYFHEFVIDKTNLLSDDLNPAPQHENCFLTGIYTVALVEDKKGKIFFADAEHLRFID